MNSNLKKLAMGICTLYGLFYVTAGAYTINNIFTQIRFPANLLSGETSQTGFRPIVTLEDLSVDDPRNTFEQAKRRAAVNKQLIAGVKSSLVAFGKVKYPSFKNTREYSPEEYECLAKNIYFEAQNETLLGQVAVALVTLHRANSKRYPSDVCGVVTQGGETRDKCQFSWYCDGHPDKPIDPDSFRRTQDVAAMMLDTTTVLPDFTFGADHYHADYVSPCWAPYMLRTTQIDTHIFYKELPTQEQCLPKVPEEVQYTAAVAY